MRERERESRTITGEATPSLNLIFDLLSNRRRRYVLYCLHEQPDGVATIGEVTDTVLAFEHRTGNSEADQDSETQRQTIQTELQHVHLPKLADAGVLEHDQRSDTVRYWTQPSLEEWLEHAQYKELPQF